MSESQICDILRKYQTIAVVGLSNEPQKDSFRVSAYLKRNGYRIIPVNPNIDKVLGEKSYPSLLGIPQRLQSKIDIVDIFRRSSDVPPIVEQSIKLKVKFGRPFVVWMQLGIVNESAAQAARREGFIVIMNRCMMVDHQKLIGHSSQAKEKQRWLLRLWQRFLPKLFSS